MKKLPTLWKNETKVTADKARKRGVDFGDKLANLRKATGRPETVEIPMRCSVTGNSATFIYTRMDAGEKFKLAQTIKGANGSNGAGALFANLLHRDVPPTQYGVQEFDGSGRVCPWCGNDRFVVDCPQCHEATCGGTIRILANGQEQHTCHPDCLHVSTLGPATHMSGGKASSRGVVDGSGKKRIGHSPAGLVLPGKQAKALSGSSGKALQKSGFRLLGGPKKK